MTIWIPFHVFLGKLQFTRDHFQTSISLDCLINYQLFSVIHLSLSFLRIYVLSLRYRLCLSRSLNLSNGPHYIMLWNPMPLYLIVTQLIIQGHILLMIRSMHKIFLKLAWEIMFRLIPSVYLVLFMLVN